MEPGMGQGWDREERGRIWERDRDGTENGTGMEPRNNGDGKRGRDGTGNETGMEPGNGSGLEQGTGQGWIPGMAGVNLGITPCKHEERQGWILEAPCSDSESGRDGSRERPVTEPRERPDLEAQEQGRNESRERLVP